MHTDRYSGVWPLAYLIGLGQFLELHLRLVLVARVLIRVPLQSALVVGLPDVVVAGLLGHAEDLVVVQRHDTIQWNPD